MLGRASLLRGKEKRLCMREGREKEKEKRKRKGEEKERTMTCRVLRKPPASHDWVPVCTCVTAVEAVAVIEAIVSGHKLLGRLTVRNDRGDLIARATVALAPTPSTIWVDEHVLAS